MQIIPAGRSLNTLERADDRSPTNSTTGRDEHVGRQPDFVFNSDLGSHEFECRMLMVMSSAAQIAFLRDDTIAADLDFAQAVNDGIIANPGVVANRDLPRIGDACRRARP